MEPYKYFKHSVRCLCPDVNNEMIATFGDEMKFSGIELVERHPFLGVILHYKFHTLEISFRMGYNHISGNFMTSVKIIDTFMYGAYCCGHSPKEKMTQRKHIKWTIENDIKPCIDLYKEKFLNKEQVESLKEEEEKENGTK